jgi:histidyl-tRNA synthetase
MKESGAGEQVEFDPTVLRGMDYYTGTVFEIYDTSPENRRALFGGGRYDDLLGLFGKAQLSGAGFGMGDVGLRNFLEVHGLLPSFGSFIDVFVSLPKLEWRSEAEAVARDLRAGGARVMTPLSVEGFGAQLKQASKHGARVAVLFGESEWAEGKLIIKDLVKGTQEIVARAEAAKQIFMTLAATEAK